MGGEASTVVEGRSGFRYGESEILKLLRVPRGSVRGKCGRRKGADGASPSKGRVGRYRRVGKIIFWGVAEF